VEDFIQDMQKEVKEELTQEDSGLYKQENNFAEADLPDPEPEIEQEIEFEKPEEVEEMQEQAEDTIEEVQEFEDIEEKPKQKMKIELEENPKQVSNTKKSNTADEELKALLAQHQATIKVIGCGGGGNNTINRITEVGVIGAETIAINTDAQDLLYTNADKKILIGRNISHGLGAGSIPKVGEEAAKESQEQIKEVLKGADMTFITCGLGGGTGTGAAPVVADISKKMGALTVAIVTLPFAMEGNRRYENALYGLEKLDQLVDTLIIIPNDKLLELAPDLPLHTAFKVADEILTNAVKGIAELVTKAGLVNLDFADIRTVMGDGGVALIGVGESDSEERAKEAVDKALKNPLLDVDIRGASGALINVAGGPDMTLEEAKIIVEAVSEKLDENARLIWGAQIREDLQGIVKTLLIVTGVKSSQIFGPSRKVSDKKRREIEQELGITFVD
jgi:cell division protein FtsZ